MTNSNIVCLASTVSLIISATSIIRNRRKSAPAVKRPQESPVLQEGKDIRAQMEEYVDEFPELREKIEKMTKIINILESDEN